MKKILKKLKADDKNTGISYPYPEEMGDGENSSMQLFQAVLVTFIGHLIIIAALILAPPLSFKKSHTPTVVSVRMVSMGDLQPEGSSAKKPVVEVPSEPKKAPAEKPESLAEASEAKVVEPEVVAPVVAEKKVAVEKKPVAPPIPEERPPEVSLAPKETPKEKAEEKPKEPPKVKTSLKKETFQPSKVVQSAIEQLEKQTEDSRPKSFQDTLAELEKKVAETPSGGTREKSQSKGGGEGGSGGGVRGKGSGSGLGGEGIGSAKEVYNGLIHYHIKKNWAFSEQMARGKSNLKTSIGIKISSNGEILDIWIDKKSGNQYLDESAIRAIKKSNPLPPLPKEIGSYYYEVGLNFTPEGLGN
jgi:colicin import membrane protein